MYDWCQNLGRDGVPKIVLKELCCISCTADVFKSFRLGVCICAAFICRLFLCLGVPVLALHFQLLAEGSQRPQGSVFGARGVACLTPVAVVCLNHCCCFASALCLSFTVCLQGKAARRASSMGQDREVSHLSLATKCLSSVDLTVALLSSLTGFGELLFLSLSCFTSTLILWFIGLSGRS